MRLVLIIQNGCAKEVTYSQSDYLAKVKRVGAYFTTWKNNLCEEKPVKNQ